MQQEVQYQILKHKSLIVLCFLSFAFYNCEFKIGKESMLSNSISIISSLNSCFFLFKKRDVKIYFCIIPKIISK